MTPVLAATAWPTNAHMILDVVRLGYLQDTDRLLDPTYGRGLWWSRWRQPDDKHDITMDGVDFRQMPEDDGTFDAVAFDPPYVAMGGRKTTGMEDFFERYGLTDAPKTPAVLQAMNNDGLRECRRVVRKRGIVIVKTQTYVSSGRLWLGAHHTMTAGLALGFEVVDLLQHVGHVRPQPPRTRQDGKAVRQIHSRQNYSTLIVFQK